MIGVREAIAAPQRRGTGRRRRAAGAPGFPQPARSAKGLPARGLHGGPPGARQEGRPPYYGYCVYKLKD